MEKFLSRFVPSKHTPHNLTRLRFSRRELLLTFVGRERKAHESSSPIDPSARSPPPLPMPSRPSSTPRKWRGFLVQHGKGCTNAESNGGSNPWFQRMLMEFERYKLNSCSTQNVLNLIITEVSRSRNNLPVLLSYLHAARNYLPSLRLGIHIIMTDSCSEHKT